MKKGFDRNCCRDSVFFIWGIEYMIRELVENDFEDAAGVICNSFMTVLQSKYCYTYTPHILPL